MTPLNTNAQKVSDFLTRITTQLLEQQGLTIGISDMAVLGAAKNLRPVDCLPILKATFQRLATENPAIIEVLLEGASESIKARIRKACGV